MRKSLVLALMASAFSTAALAQQTPNQEQDQCALLLTMVRSQNNATLTITQVEDLQRANDQTRCGTEVANLRNAQPAAGAGNAPAGNAVAQGQPGAVTPAQPGGELRSNQNNNLAQAPAGGGAVAQPGQSGQVAAQGGQIQTQAEAAFVVQQPMPQITVNQPAPTITIDIPQPEIVVQMPTPRVGVTPGEAQVMADGAQPTVQYQQAEPRVVINRAPGEPTVRFEQVDAAQGGLVAGAAAPGQPGGNAGVQAGQPAGQQQAALGDQPAAGAALGPSGAGTNISIVATELVGDDIFDAQGERIGRVEDVVRFSNDNKHYIVINHDGALNLGDKRIALDLSDAYMDGERLMVIGSAEQVRAFPEWQTGPGYSPAGNESLQIRNGR